MKQTTLTTILAVALSALPVLASEEHSIIENGDFSDQLVQWKLVELGSAQGTVEVLEEDGTKSARIQLVEPGQDHWSMFFSNNSLSLAANQNYEVRFRARSSSYRVFGVAFLDPHTPVAGSWENVATTEWKEYVVPLTSPADVPDAALIFGNLGQNEGWLEVADVRVVPID